MKTALTITLLVCIAISLRAQQSPVATRVTNPADTPVKNRQPIDGILAKPKVDDKKIADETKENQLSALVAYNFSGGNKKLANLTPVIEYGWVKDWSISGKYKEGDKKGEAKNMNAITFGINPYVGGQIDMRDSSSYIPGLMLPGVAGIKTDLIFTFKKNDEGFKFAVSPLNFGYKLISNFSDSSLTIAQHNLRSSLGFGYGDLFMITAQYTYGWHNSISESEKGFKSAFGKSATDIQYLNVTLQTKLSKLFGEVPTYLYAEWRGLLNTDAYPKFDNSRIITIGIRSSMSFRTGMPAAIPKSKRN